ncbi:MAG: hypothetical protein ACO263_11425, partial [Cyclobacteriaceae bacterium]
MYLPFTEMPGHSRVWIYPANRQLTASEKVNASELLKAFCEQWSAHGHRLNASFRIDYDRFLVVAVDEKSAAASGCSIDASVHAIQRIGNELKLDLFDRTLIPFLIGGTILDFKLKDLSDSFRNGKIGPRDQTFNLLASTKEEWESNGVVAVEKSWLA